MIHDLVRDFPKQCTLAEKTSIKLPFARGRIRSVVIAGMGGSGMAADAAAELFSLPVPVFVMKGETLPAFADEHTLLIAISYSGSTRETLRLVAEAQKKKCMIVGIASGGSLSQRVGHVVRVPAGMPPRASTPSLFFGIASVFAALGFVRPEAYSGIGAFLESQRSAIEKQAAQIGKLLHNKLPVVYSSSSAVARRFCGQLNENAKIIAHCAVFPEANHNEMASFQEPSSVAMAAVFLRFPGESPDVRTGLDFVRELAEHRGTPTCTATASGKTRLQQLFSLFWLADCASIETAKLRNVDAENIYVVTELKKRLGQNGPV